MQRYPGEPAARQPVHTVYGGAQLYRAETTQRLGELALRHLDGYARDAFEFAEALALRRSCLAARAAAESGLGARPERIAARAAGRVARIYGVRERETQAAARSRWRTSASNSRMSFGARPDGEEDLAGREAAQRGWRWAVRRAMLPPFIGIRIWSPRGRMEGAAARARSELFLDTLLSQSGRSQPRTSGGDLAEGRLGRTTPHALVRLFELLEPAPTSAAEPVRCKPGADDRSHVQALGSDADGTSPLPGVL